MSRASVLARGRTAAEAGMVDTCTIRRQVGTSTNPVTGVVTPTYDVIYAGKCRVQQQVGQQQARPEDAGEAYRLMLALQLQLPMSATGIAAEDEVTIDSSVHDADLVGRMFRVRELFHKTHATARRVGLVEQTS